MTYAYGDGGHKITCGKCVYFKEFRYASYTYYCENLLRLEEFFGIKTDYYRNKNHTACINFNMRRGKHGR